MSGRAISKLSVVCLSAVIGCVLLTLCIFICKNIFSDDFLLYHSSITTSHIIGIFLCCFIGAASGITGIFKSKVHGLERLLCIICSLFCICFILFMLLPAHINSRVINRRISCASTLRQIYLALQQYATDYAGNYPPANGAAGLEELRKEGYMTGAFMFVCPNTSTTKCKSDQPLTEENVDYVYIGGLNTKSDPKQPLMYDKANNHGYYGSVLFADGTVEGIYGNPWTQNIKK